MKKTLAVITLLASLCANIFADGKPSWYTEEVQVSEMEIRRKNSEGVYADFIDRTFSACAHVLVTGEIQSLEEARAKAEKAASEKLDSYFKSHKENEALKAKHELYGWSYDYSLENGGAYVQVQVVVKKEKPKETKNAVNGKDARMELLENPNPGRVILYGSDRLTLVDKISFASEESIESHRVVLTTKKGSKGRSQKNKEAIHFADNPSPLYDTVYYLENMGMQFRLKNIIKGRKTLIIIRTNTYSKNDEVCLDYNGQKFRSKIEKNQNLCWRNIIFEIPEGTITEYSPQFEIEALKENQMFGTIFVYQLL